MYSEAGRFIEELNFNTPVTQIAIDSFEKTSRIKLPLDYVSFLEQTDGAEGFVGNNYVILWKIEEILELNDAYKVSEYKSGLLVFGSNGGGEAFAFDKDSDPMSVVQVPFVSINRDGMIRLGSTFVDFLNTLYQD